MTSREEFVAAAREADVLDLFGGPGGTARGFLRLGFDVVGIDLVPSPKYPAPCLGWDLREGLPPELVGESFRYVWASPPCLFATRLNSEERENLIPLARDLLEEVDATATVIENVPEARPHLERPITLSGATEREEFDDLEVRKQRVFETSWPSTSPPRARDAQFHFAIGDRETPARGFREAHGLGASGLDTKELRDAIPPAYVEFLVWQESRHRERVREAYR